MMQTMTRGNESSATGYLLVAFELSQRWWKVGFTTGMGGHIDCVDAAFLHLLEAPQHVAVLSSMMLPPNLLNRRGCTAGSTSTSEEADNAQELGRRCRCSRSPIHVQRFSEPLPAKQHGTLPRAITEHRARRLQAPLGPELLSRQVRGIYSSAGSQAKGAAGSAAGSWMVGPPSSWSSRDQED